MDFFSNLFQIQIPQIIDIISLDSIIILMQTMPFAYGIALALFCCALLLGSAFSRYKMINLKILFAWILSCGATFIYLINGHAEMDAMQLDNALHSQVILSCASTIILLLTYLLELIGTKPHKPAKQFNRRAWWVRIVRFVVAIVRFIVIFAFCCIFNIGLFVAAALFYW